MSTIVASKIFREKLVKMVQKAGQDLIDRAEDLVGNGDLISNFDIWIRFPINEQIGFPEIEVTRQHIVKNAMYVESWPVDDE